MVRCTALSVILLIALGARGDPLPQANDQELRRPTFGLENFLSQPLALEEITESADIKRVRPGPRRKKNGERGQTYGLESLAPKVYAFEGFEIPDLSAADNRGPVTFDAQDHYNRVTKEDNFEPEEPVFNVRPPSFHEPRRKLQRRPLEKPMTFQTTTETTTEEVITPAPSRPMKRKVLRRRKKRPTVAPQSEEPITSPPQELPQESEKLEVETLEPMRHHVEQEPITTEPPLPPPSAPALQKQGKVKDQELIKRRKRPLGFRRTSEPTTEQQPTESYEPFEAESKHKNTFKEPEIQHNIDIPETTTAERPKERFPPTGSDIEELGTPEEEEKNVSQDVKSLLKQQMGTLSLSEILQTQNLSLADFLKGKGTLAAIGKGKQEEAPQPKIESRRDQVKTIPRISVNSRPFSKSTNEQKPFRITDDLPKTLDVQEVTDQKPTYNGFQPKNPRTRLHKERLPPVEETADTVKNTIKTQYPFKRKPSQEEDEVQPTVRVRTTPPTTTTVTTEAQPTEIEKETTLSDPKLVVPKRYGDLRQKLRIDRRKWNSSTTAITTERSGEVSTQTVSLPPSVTGRPEGIEERPPKPQKPRVRVPFMSANNPEVSVIIQNKTGVPEKKEKVGPNVRDRFKMFNKRVHGRGGEKQEREEDEVEDDESLENLIQPARVQTTQTQPATTSTTNKPTTTTTTTTTTEEPFDLEAIQISSEMEHEITKKNCTEQQETTENPETQDEIIELLKSGNNVQRLKRILAQRNMTLEELLENREQGSSKAVFPVTAAENKTAPVRGEDRQEKKIRDPNELKVFQSFPDFTSDNRISVNPTQWSKGAKIQETSGFDELLAEESIISQVRVKPGQSESGQFGGRVHQPQAPEKNDHRVHLNLSPGDPSIRAPLPGWNVDEKSIYASSPYGYPRYDGRPLQTSRVIPEVKIVETSPLEDNDVILLETIKKSQEANRKLKTGITDILQEQAEVKEHHVNEMEKTFIPPAVKSAIIASGVVLGIALFVFVAIFAACGWKQRQIRLKARSSILNDTLSREKKHIKRTNTMSPISFKQSSLYKKALDFDETASTNSGSSNASSYLWNTLKNTFTSRNSTLKNRLEKEEKEREEQILRNTLKREDTRKSTMSREERISTLQRQERQRQAEERLFNTLQRPDRCEERFSSLRREGERGTFKKIDPERSVVKTSLNFKRGGLNASNHFNSCGHIN